MKTTISLKLALGLLTGAAALWSATASQAQFYFHVNIDTAPLMGSTSGPFSLDFQLNDGSGTFANPNTAIISNFSFSGGSAAGTATTTAGVTGDLSSMITLTDTSAFPTEFYQQFMPGSTIGFDVALTTLPEFPTPDAFSVAILDNALANIPTTGVGDSLLLVNIDKPILRLGDVQTFSGTGSFGGVSALASVPEPASLGSLALLTLATAGSLLRLRRKRA